MGMCFLRDKKHIPLFRSPEGIEDIMNNIRFFSSDSDITISLKKLNYYMLIAAFLISAILFFAMHQNSNQYLFLLFIVFDFKFVYRYRISICQIRNVDVIISFIFIYHFKSCFCTCWNIYT